MSDRHHRGSVLLFCIAMVGALAVLAYGFVRVAQLGGQTGDSSNLHLLARQAAQTGLNHAVEQLVRDYIREPYTRMDVPGIAMNQSHDLPYLTYFGFYDIAVAGGGAEKLNMDSVAAENSMDRITANGDGSLDVYSTGSSSYFPLSRFYEPEFYNQVSAPAGVSAASAVSTPVRFNTPWPGAPYPDRSGGVFYDQQLRRVTGVTETVRETARYRLRYAIMTQDLEGMFLVNGDQAVDYRDITSNDPTSGSLSAAAARIVRNMHKVPPVLLAEDGWAQDNRGSMPYIWIDGPFRGEHAFIGRGSTANVDRNPAKGNAPCTFPLMYRWQDNAQSFIEYGNPDGWPAAENLFSKTSIPNVAGLAAGGEVISNISATWTNSLFEHILVGPQFTPSNFQTATYGHGNRELHSRGSGNGNNGGQVSTLGRYSVFGRGVSKRVGGEAVSRYRGNTDTPWCLNVLTIAPNVVRGMVQGYMPPGAMHTFYYNRTTWPKNWNANTGYTVGQHVLADGNRLYRCVQAGTSAGSGGPSGTGSGITDNSVRWDFVTTEWDDSDSYRATLFAQRDLFVSPLSTAFQRYAPPARAAPAISPDFHVRAMVNGDPGYRLPKDRYPGKMVLNGYDETVAHTPGQRDLAGKWTHDSLGYYLRSVQSTRSQFDQELGSYLSTGRTRARAIDRMQPYFPSNNLNAPIASHGTAAASFWKQIPHSVDGNTNPICGQALSMAWSAVTPYAVGNIVPWGPTYYICTSAGTSGWGGPASSPDGTVTWSVYTGPRLEALVTAPPYSIWEKIGEAMAAAVSMVQGRSLQYANKTTPGGPDRQQSAFFNGSAWVDNATVPGVSLVGSIKDLDALFVTNLGHSWSVPNDPTTVPVWFGAGGYPWKLGKQTPTWNIAGLNPTNPKITGVNPALVPAAAGAPGVPGLALASWNDPLPETGYDSSKDSFTAQQRTQAMELVINDFRLSFFGSSPQYGSNFRAFDFNGDGKACCSGFVPNGGATVAETDLHIDQYTTNVDPSTGIANVEVDNYFSNTGCFFIGKSRFWRIMVRGEVWDNLLKVTNNTVDLDSVICLDPTDADNAMSSAPHNPGRQYATHLLYQAWIYNNCRSLLPRRD